MCPDLRPRPSAIALVFLALPCARAAAQTTTLASPNSNSDCIQSVISADARCVAFTSFSDTLVAGDTNFAWDVFVYDRASATTTRVSVSSAGAQANGESHWPSISADGRYVAFDGVASSLVAGDANNASDIFVRDRQSGTTTRVSLSSAGVEGNGESRWPGISADGRYVVFASSANTLVAGDTNNFEDIFVRDRQSGTTTRVSVSSAGVQANSVSLKPAISADGRYVAFQSHATNLVAGDTNNVGDIFVRDLVTGTTTRASVSSLGVQANAECLEPALSADGRFVGFWGAASTLVAGDTNATDDVFVHDVLGGATIRVSLGAAGVQANSGSARPAFSSDGRYVAFQSVATNLVAGDTNAASDIFVRDLAAGLTRRASVSSAGVQSNGFSEAPSISANGRYVVFDSSASNLVAGDTNMTPDVFVRDEDMAVVAFCDPGIGGVLSCPCGNAPSAPGRGCNNSLGTGGASIGGIGTPSLAADSLVVSAAGIGSSGAACSGAVTNLTGILLQGDANNLTGVAFNDGVRCLSGSLKRIETGTSVSGTFSSTLSISARSAALGDTIVGGSSRYYGVWHRDPCVSFACAATSTLSNGLVVRWSP